MAERIATPTDEQAQAWTTQQAELIGALRTAATVEAFIADPTFDARLDVLRGSHLRLAQELEDYLEGQREHIAKAGHDRADQG